MKETEYGSINLDSLVYGKTVSLAESFANIEPIGWPETVLNGSDHVVVTVYSGKGENKGKNV